MMTTIFALLFLISLCVITMGYAHVQKMAVKLVGLLTEAPVINVPILPVEDNKGRVTNEKSLAYMEESRDAGILRLHYPDKTIRLAALAAGVHTMLMRPENSLALARFVITHNADKAALSIQILKKIAASRVNRKGTAEQRRYQHLPAQAPEYSGDGFFRVSARDHPLINEPYTTDKSQLYESVAGAGRNTLSSP
ncbi:hypothetical protein PQ465_19145 [Sphingobacterium oryzagri]|uniref:Uncharacterized protein n=1 Tax=Sphingobacterium oryzagri TaxID=3025669 RepID=A0ABY7WIM6_9SPHI|nr:hypothetical protein [Sphingobacterium sp. KACC 22765]WDF68397.1 hypothetical protein PQ465_19145 [Sphingobacterium sp. KACC 22765]